MHDTKNIISADLENVGQRHRLQKSLNLSSYLIYSNQTFVKMMQLWLTSKADIKIVGQCYIAQVKLNVMQIFIVHIS